MKNLSSYRKKEPDIRRINIEKFILIFNRGLAAGLTVKQTGNHALVKKIQHDLKNVFNANGHEVRVLWENDPALRSEWQDNFDAFLGFVELDVTGHMRVVVGKKIA